MKKHLLAFAIVSLFVIGMLPVVEAPNNETWDILYEANNTYPEDEGWTRTTTGTVGRAFQYHNQVLNISLTGASTDRELYQYTLTSSTPFLVFEARLNIPVAYPSSTPQDVYFRFQRTDNSEFNIQISQNEKVRLTYPKQGGAATYEDYYISNYTGFNHTYTVVLYQAGVNGYMDFYYDHEFVAQVEGWHALDFSIIKWESRDSGSGDKYFEWDHVLVRTEDLSGEIKDLEDELEDLEKELERLRKRLGDSLPPVYVNETELSYIPYRNRGIDDDLVFIDPYRTLVATVKASPDAASSVALYLPYDTAADEVTCIQDDLWIGGTFTHIYINNTDGDSLLDSTSTYTYFGDCDCQNVTVETVGGNVIANRITVVREIISFNWGWNRDSGLFAHTSTISNSIAYDMENVRCYWAFPTEDSDGRDVQIDVASIEVWDDDNNVQLDKGRHYEATEAGGVSLEYRWVNTSGTTASRTVRIQFSRARDVQGESYYTIYDNDIAFSDAYGDAPYVALVHHTQHDTANFAGRVIIKFSLSGKYAGNHLDTRSLKIKRSDSSLFQEFTYDSIANELRITDVTISAGESVVFSLYFDWYDEKSAVYELILGDPLILYSLLLLAGVSGLFIYLDATKEEKRRKYAGLIIIAVDVIILVIVLLAG